MWLMYEAGLWFGERLVIRRRAEKAARESDTSASESSLPVTAAASSVAATDLLPDHPSSAVYDFKESLLSIDPPKDPIVDNALDTDEDFERAFAQMESERRQLDETNNKS